MANAPKSCLWELATFLVPNSDSQQDAKQLASNTGFFKNAFYSFSLIIFFHFTRVWLDNLKCNLQKGWALNSCNRGQNSWVWARAMFNSIKNNLESHKFHSWNPKWVKGFHISFSSLLGPACRRGTAAHLHITKMQCKQTYLSAQHLCNDEHSEKNWWGRW